MSLSSYTCMSIPKQINAPIIQTLFLGISPIPQKSHRFNVCCMGSLTSIFSEKALFFFQERDPSVLHVKQCTLQCTISMVSLV